jgi:Family of unknown function (DUF6364)
MPDSPNPAQAWDADYTYSVDKPKRNLTLVIEEDLLLVARKVALDQRTSVSQLVRKYLSALVGQHGKRRLARARLANAFSSGVVELGERNWTRDSLHRR